MWRSLSEGGFTVQGFRIRFHQRVLLSRTLTQKSGMLPKQASQVHECRVRRPSDAYQPPPQMTMPLVSPLSKYYSPLIPVYSTKKQSRHTRRKIEQTKLHGTTETALLTREQYDYSNEKSELLIIELKTWTDCWNTHAHKQTGAFLQIQSSFAKSAITNAAIVTAPYLPLYQHIEIRNVKTHTLSSNSRMYVYCCHQYTRRSLSFSALRAWFSATSPPNRSSNPDMAAACSSCPPISPL